MQRYLLAFILLCSSWGVQAQSPAETFTQYLQAINTQGVVQLPSRILENVAGNENALYEAAVPFLTDPSKQTRTTAHWALHRIALNSPSEPFQQEMVNLFLQTKNGPTLYTVVSNWLSAYPPTSFDLAARSTLSRYIRADSSAYEPMIRLAGYLYLNEVGNTIVENLLEPNKLTEGERWTSWVVLARLGYPNAITYLQNNLSRVAVDDEIIYGVYPDVVYTRQKELVSLIVETVMSDDTQCSSANNDSDETILCAYRAMEFLPGVIQDFPWQRDVTGDLDVDDYETALTQIRQWFVVHEDYQINRYDP